MWLTCFHLIFSCFYTFSFLQNMNIFQMECKFIYWSNLIIFGNLCIGSSINANTLFVCISPLYLSGFNWLHSLYILPYLTRRTTWFENFDMYSNIWNVFVFWWWIFTFFSRYCYISEISTTTKNTIPVWNNVRRWIDIYTVDWIFCMNWSYILVRTIWIYFINVIICFSSPDRIFFNVIFTKPISNLLYVLIHMNLIQTES